MRKYIIIYIIIFAFLAATSFAVHSLPFRFPIQVFIFFVTGVTMAITMHVVKDAILRKVKQLDYSVYQKMRKSSGQEQGYGFNIDRSYPYSEDIQKLIVCWNIYIALALGLIIPAFLLMIIAS